MALKNYQIPSRYIVRKTEELTDVTYIGYSVRGTATNSDEWRIQKISISGSITTIEYASGSWDNRLTLNYV